MKILMSQASLNGNMKRNMIPAGTLELLELQDVKIKLRDGATVYPGGAVRNVVLGRSN